MERDSYFKLLSPYYNDSIFTHLFCQKKHILDYQLNKNTVVSMSCLGDIVDYVVGHDRFRGYTYATGDFENADTILVDYLNNVQANKYLGMIAYQIDVKDFTYEAIMFHFYERALLLLHKGSILSPATWFKYEELLVEREGCDYSYPEIKVSSKPSDYLR
jgi:hypothetical protein